MARLVKVAAAHVAPVFMKPLESAHRAAEWIGRAGQDGVDVIVFPEVYLPGFPYWINSYPPLHQVSLNRRYQDASIEIDGPEVAVLREAARDAGVLVVMGASERAQGARTCYNSAILIDKDGALLGVHRKLKPTYAERYIWGQGDGSGLWVKPTSAGRIGALCCWEHMMNLARQALAEQQEEIHAALWPGLSTMAGFEAVSDIQIEAMMRNHALTAQCFVICASSPVTQEMMDFMANEFGSAEMLAVGAGYSAIFHPFAATVAGPKRGSEEGLVIAEIDLDDCSDAKMWVDGTGHYSRPDVLALQFDRRAKPTLVEITD
ncbi:MAG: carbon-nitrogen hydrolase family protein [Pseudomonadota bacterium]